MKRYLLDSNVVLRHLLADVPEHSAAAARAFESAFSGKLTLVLTSLVAAECVFVLESFYKRSKKEIARTLGLLLQQPGVEAAELEVLLLALQHYASRNAHFADAYLMAKSATESDILLSFDERMKELSGAKVASPLTVFR